MCCEGKKATRVKAAGPKPNERETHYHECDNPECIKPVFHRFGSKAGCPNSYHMRCPDCSISKVPMFCNLNER